MARIRTIKPELGAHEGLFDLELETGLPIRFAWCMLFTVADREGRFQWRPRTLKAQILPHDLVEFSRVLDAWVTRGFVVKYRVGEEWFGWIPTFTKHQVINNREAASDLPSIEQADEIFSCAINNFDASGTRDPRVDDASGTREVHAQGEGKGRERKEGKENTSSAAPASPTPPADLVPADPPVLTFLLNDGSEFGISQQQAREFRELFPAIDVMQELRSLKAWCIGNRQNRKTRTGAMKFVTGWLSRAQNRAPAAHGAAQQQSDPNRLPRLRA